MRLPLSFDALRRRLLILAFALASKCTSTTDAQHALFNSEQDDECVLHYRSSSRGGRRLSWSASLKDVFTSDLLPAWT